MPKSSIQRRLIAAVVISQLLLAIGLATFTVYFTRVQFRHSFDESLHGRAMSIAALVRYTEEEPPTLVFESDLAPPPLDPNHPDLYQVTVAGRLIARSPNWPSQLSADFHHGYAWFSLGNVHYRGLQETGSRSGSRK